MLEQELASLTPPHETNEADKVAAKPAKKPVKTKSKATPADEDSVKTPKAKSKADAKTNAKVARKTATKTAAKPKIAGTDTAPKNQRPPLSPRPSRKQSLRLERNPLRRQQSKPQQRFPKPRRSSPGRRIFAWGRRPRVKSRARFLSPDSASASHDSVRIFVEHVCEDFSRSSCWPLQRAPPYPRWPTLGPGRNAGASGSMVITCGAAVRCRRDTIIIARLRAIGRRPIGIRDRWRASSGP